MAAEEKAEAQGNAARSVYIRLSGGDERWRDWNKISYGDQGRRIANWLCYFSIRGFGRLERDAQNQYMTSMVSQLEYVMILEVNTSRRENNAKVVLRNEQTWKTLVETLHNKTVWPFRGQGAERMTFTFSTKAMAGSTTIPIQQQPGNSMASLLMSTPVQAEAAVQTAATLASSQLLPSSMAGLTTTVPGPTAVSVILDRERAVPSAGVYTAVAESMRELEEPREEGWSVVRSSGRRDRGKGSSKTSTTRSGSRFSPTPTAPDNRQPPTIARATLANNAVHMVDVSVSASVASMEGEALQPVQSFPNPPSHQ
jgi:hypothetical protein